MSVTVPLYAKGQTLCGTCDLEPQSEGYIVTVNFDDTLLARDLLAHRLHDQDAVYFDLCYSEYWQPVYVRTGLTAELKR